MKTKQNGFTLLEVMIAIAVFALIATTMSQTTSIAVDSQIHLEQKLLANWIAENKITSLRSVSWEELKNSREDVETANRKWVINIKAVDKKSFPGIPAAVSLPIKEIIIDVALAESPDYPLISLVAYMANEDA